MPLHRVPLDRAITTIYKLLKVTMSICSFLAAILNAVLLSAAVTYVRQITVSYPSTDFSVQCSPGRVWVAKRYVVRSWRYRWIGR